MNKTKYIISFIFLMIITIVVSYVAYVNNREDVTNTDDQRSFDGVTGVAKSGFFGEFEKFLSSYDEIVNTTDATSEIIMPQRGDLVGSIAIPSISLEANLFYGDDETELSRGVGIDPRQKIPGQDGNVILAGHNISDFGALGGLKIGDEVFLNTNYGIFKYNVEYYMVTQYDDLTVIVPKEHEFLTMYTCYPFDQYTPSEKRFVVTCTYVGRE